MAIQPYHINYWSVWGEPEAHSDSSQLATPWHSSFNACKPKNTATSSTMVLKLCRSIRKLMRFNRNLTLNGTLLVFLYMHIIIMPGNT